jgi:hypothetical protein
VMALTSVAVAGVWAMIKPSLLVRGKT